MKSEERRWLRAGGVFNEVSEQGDRRRLRWRVAADEMGGVRGGGVRCLVDKINAPAQKIAFISFIKLPRESKEKNPP